MTKLVVVIGGGISGLATAHYLRERAQVVVLEADARPGGKLWTLPVGGIPVEAGADSFVVRKPWAIELCNDLGLQDQVVIPGSFGAFVRTRRGLMPFPEASAFGVPASAVEVLRWSGLPMLARVRALGDLARPARRGGSDEALGSLLERRLGPEAARVLVEPLLAGLHAGDPGRLSVQATFPELAAWEHSHGSLMRGSRAAVKAAGRQSGYNQPLFATVWGGLSRLVDTLAQALGPGTVRLDSPATALFPTREGPVVDTTAGQLRSDAVVLATPAFESARLLGELNPDASEGLGRIPYASTAVVILVYPPGTGTRLPPEGTGFVVPPDGGVITACTWVNRKWPSDQIGDRAVLRCFVGRAGVEGALSWPDDQLVNRVRGEVESLTPLGVEPESARVVRWDRAMPQYEVGHLAVLDRIDRALLRTPGIFLTGSAYRGVGIADCVRQARETAHRVMAHLGEGNGSRPGADAHEEATTWTR